MTFQGSIQDLQAAEVIDSTGDKVGKVGQVYLTNDSQEPSWVTVNTGLFGTKETFIPLAEARYADGAIAVPYEKSFIKDAPHVDEDGEISREEEDELYRYYGVADDATAGTGTRDLDRDGIDGRDAALAGGAGAGVGAGLGTDGRREDRELDKAERDLERGDRHQADADAQYAQGHELRGDVDERLAEHDDKNAARHADRAERDGLGDDGVTLHEERVSVGTERVETGRARLRKYVVTETEQVEVPVRREEVVLEREPATGTGDGRLGEEEASVTLSEERPVIEKETVATENVSLGKRTVEDTRTVDTEVSHEEVDVDGVDVVEGRDGRDRI